MRKTLQATAGTLYMHGSKILKHSDWAGGAFVSSSGVTLQNPGALHV